MLSAYSKHGVIHTYTLNREVKGGIHEKNTLRDRVHIKLRHIRIQGEENTRTKTTLRKFAHSEKTHRKWTYTNKRHIRSGDTHETEEPIW